MTKTFMMRLSDADHKDLSDAAYEARVSMAEYVRQAVELRKLSGGPLEPSHETVLRAGRMLLDIAQKLAAGYVIIPPEEEEVPDQPERAVPASEVTTLC